MSVDARAQSNFVSALGDATGVGGTSSFSIGQVFFDTQSGIGGTIVPGLQQPYEIFVITNTSLLHNKINLQVFPNPATDMLFISFDKEEVGVVRMSLVDMQGNVLISDRVIKTTTSFNLSGLRNGTYFIKIYNKQNLSKTLKIIKCK